MEFLMGAISSIFFIAVIGGAYLLGRGKRVKPSQVSQEEKDRLERLHKGLSDMLNYDISKAYKGR